MVFIISPLLILFLLTQFPFFQNLQKLSSTKLAFKGSNEHVALLWAEFKIRLWMTNKVVHKVYVDSSIAHVVVRSYSKRLQGFFSYFLKHIPITIFKQYLLLLVLLNFKLVFYYLKKIVTTWLKKKTNFANTSVKLIKFAVIL